MIELRIPPSRDQDWWEGVASESLLAYAEAEGAVLWPEAEAVLCESQWVHRNVYSNFPLDWRIDPLHLASARAYLRRYGHLLPETAVLGGHKVTAYIHAASVAKYGRSTAIRTRAAQKRRLYRRFLKWTSRTTLCGGHAERIVDATIAPLKGEALWVPASVRSGRVKALLGRPLEVGGPLDHAGYWVANVETMTGLIPFAVEVKNIRSVIYPWDNEMWDLLAKLAAFPDVVPVLVARKIHPTAFNMFRDIGALGVQFKDQWFSQTIGADDFARVAGGLHLHNAKQVEVAPQAPMTKLFGETGPRIGLRFLERWAEIAPIAADFVELRDPALDHGSRRRLWATFAERVRAAGFYERGGWAPKEVEDSEEDDRFDDW